MVLQEALFDQDCVGRHILDQANADVMTGLVGVEKALVDWPKLLAIARRIARNHSPDVVVVSGEGPA